MDFKVLGFDNFRRELFCICGTRRLAIRDEPKLGSMENAYFPKTFKDACVLSPEEVAKKLREWGYLKEGKLKLPPTRVLDGK